MKQSKNNEPSLLILAAGMGNRYGGLKQIDTFGPNGEALIDYTMYDAIKAGFKKIVFLIREEFYPDFKDRFSEHLRSYNIQVEYAYQKVQLDNYSIKSERQKPWGTGEAVLSAKDKIQEPFVVVNADDFYGFHALKNIYDFLYNLPSDSKNHYGLIAYLLQATLSRHGKVSRGIISLNGGGKLSNIQEYKNVKYLEDQIKGNHVGESEVKALDPENFVSMNLWGFTPDIFGHLENLFHEFMKQNADSLDAEFFLPEAVSQLLNDKLVTVDVQKTDEDWFGVTYKEDKKYVEQSINEKIKKGVYPEKLWK